MNLADSVQGKREGRSNLDQVCGHRHQLPRRARRGAQHHFGQNVAANYCVPVPPLPAAQATRSLGGFARLENAVKGVQAGAAQRPLEQYCSSRKRQYVQRNWSAHGRGGAISRAHGLKRTWPRLADSTCGRSNS